MIGLIAGIAQYVSSGPFFAGYADSTKGCREYGWFNVLYMNIYQDIMKDHTSGVNIIFDIE